MSNSINLMLNKIILGLLATSIPAACAYPSISQLETPPKVDVSVNEEKAVVLEVVEKTWTCPSCNENEKYVLKELQEKTKISDRTHWQRFWVILSPKAIFIQIFVREVQEFHMTDATPVVTV